MHVTGTLAILFQGLLLTLWTLSTTVAVFPEKSSSLSIVEESSFIAEEPSFLAMELSSLAEDSSSLAEQQREHSFDRYYIYTVTSLYNRVSSNVALKSLFFIELYINLVVEILIYSTADLVVEY